MVSKLIWLHRVLQMPSWCLIDSDDTLEVGVYWCSGAAWVAGLALLIYIVILYYRCTYLLISAQLHGCTCASGIPPHQSVGGYSIQL